MGLRSFSLTFCSYFVDLYTGGNIETSVSDALAFWILISVQMFAYSGAVFLNAAEKFGRIGFSVFSASLLVPAVLFLFSTGFSCYSSFGIGSSYFSKSYLLQLDCVSSCRSEALQDFFIIICLSEFAV